MIHNAAAALIVVLRKIYSCKFFYSPAAFNTELIIYNYLPCSESLPPRHSVLAASQLSTMGLVHYLCELWIHMALQNPQLDIFHQLASLGHLHSETKKTGMLVSLNKLIQCIIQSLSKCSALSEPVWPGSESL